MKKLKETSTNVELTKKKRIQTLMREIVGSIEQYCDENCEMPGTFEYEEDTDNNFVFVRLTYDGGGLYELEDVYVANRDDIRRTCIEDALVGCTLDMTQTAEQVEEWQDDMRRYHKDPYEYNGVSRWDFL